MRRAVAPMLLVGVLMAGCGNGEGETSAPKDESPADGAAAIDSCDAEAFSSKYPDLDGRTIRLGIDPTFPPMTGVDADDPTQYVGHEPEYAMATLDCIGLSYEFVPGDFVGLIPALQADQIDLMWTALLYTPERAETINYIVYLKAGQTALVPQGNPKGITSLDDLCGNIMALNTGTVQEQMAQDQSSDCEAAGELPVEIQTYTAGATPTFLAVQNGRADVMMTDSVLAGEALKEYTDLEKGFSLVTDDLFGVGIRKEDVDLMNALFDAMSILEADATHEQIIQANSIDLELVHAPEIRTS